MTWRQYRGHEIDLVGLSYYVGEQRFTTLAAARAHIDVMCGAVES